MCPVHLCHRVNLVDRNFLVQKIYFLLPTRNYKAQSGLAIKKRNFYWIIAPSG